VSPVTPRIEASDPLAGRYRLKRRMARGGMGEIWQAADLETGASVAVKRLVVPEDQPLTGEPRVRLMREADALKRLSHPNIVRYLASGFDAEDQPFLVLEWLDGEDLRRRQRRDPLALQQALRVVDQVLEGLAACHAQGIVHRDLKPSNVFLVDDGGSKLLDFGVAWLMDHMVRMTRTGVVMGSLHHLAPEQIKKGGQVDSRTDIYAVGVLLYELATGELPFSGNDPAAVLQQIVCETPSLPSLVRPDLPSWVDDVVLRAMMRAPADRYQSTAEMRAALAAEGATGTTGSDATLRSAPREPEEPSHEIIAPVQLKEGDMAGEYQVTGLLARGGMGTIYHGVHPLIGKRVAIKVLRPECCENPHTVDRFLAEAQAVNAIRHPNIVDIFAFGTLAGGSRYLVMEFLEGVRLTEFLEANRPVSYRDARALLAQITGALGDAHDKGIVHRDLKPDNVMVMRGPDGQLSVKLLDFGIAKFTEDASLSTLPPSRTRTGVPIGTPVYMSPEQCAGEGTDHRSDIYALGVLMYQMFTGQVPFTGPSIVAIINAQVNEAPTPPRQLCEIPADLEAVILRCLAKSKEHRPTHVAELRAELLPALERACHGDETRPQPTRGATPTPGRLRGLALAAAALLVVLGSVVAFLGLRDPESKPRAPGAIRRAAAPAPAAAPATVPAPGPATAPAAPRRVLFQLQVEPREARHSVWVDGERQLESYFRVPMSEERRIAIEVRAPGYETWQLKTFPVSSQTLQVRLRRKPPRHRPAKRSREPQQPEKKKDDDITTVL
jgi:serine/threonine protein kinase